MTTTRGDIYRGSIGRCYLLDDRMRSDRRRGTSRILLLDIKLIPDLTADWMSCINILVLSRSRLWKLSDTEKDSGGIWADGEGIVGKV